MRLALDHHYSPAIAVGLRSRGHNVVAAIERGRHTLDDAELLAACRAESRALLTNNVADFAVIARVLAAESQLHYGLVFAHYFSLAVFAGQRTVALASDPLDNGSNLFGTANYSPDYAILSDSQIAVIQVAAVITGHVLGAVAAHDRAARLFDHKAAVTGQLPLLGLMLAYTTGGLSLLFAS